MKRKDVDDAYEEFTDFSTSAPARKIRRLDALPSIVEEEEPVPVIPLVFNHQVRDEQLDASMIEVESTLPGVNDEKALVLYKPVNDRVFSVSSDVISGIMNQYLWPRTPVNADGAQRPPVNNCLAMVPWQAPFRAPVDMPPEEELMDAEVTEASSMEVEEVNSGEAVNTGDSFQQWQQQQHCMTVQLPPNRSTPIMWSRV